MRKIWTILEKSLDRTTSSIAFIPALLAISGLLLSFLIVAIEYEPIIIELKKRITFLLVTSQEEGRLILGTLVGSIISMMVFSFSMVMIVLGRASSNLSPRVLPGLISNKPHQFVLGFYLGTILYSLIMIVNFQKNTEYTIPSFGILLAMAFGITCLSLFVYFIHSISKSIQVESIIYNIFKSTIKQMEICHLNEKQVESLIPPIHGWREICTEEAGYLKKMNTGHLLKLSVKYDFQLAIQKPIGLFLVQGYPFLKINCSEEISRKTIEDIRACFTFYTEDQVKDHFIFGFKQISEIATKALSPGINDPGTAIKALDLLSVLFIKRMTINVPYYKVDLSEKIRIIYSPVSLEELIFHNLVPIREYGKADVLVLLKLLEVLKNMIYADREKKEFTGTLVETVRSCVQTAESFIQNSLDRQQVNSLINDIEEALLKTHQFNYLKI
ncbi:MAG: DUF2254 domain-containing protein [Anditalea sp.]